MNDLEERLHSTPIVGSIMVKKVTYEMGRAPLRARPAGGTYTNDDEMEVTESGGWYEYPEGTEGA